MKRAVDFDVAPPTRAGVARWRRVGTVYLGHRPAESIAMFLTRGGA